jgi:photosystem II stability/assembly factor-like uncharacterized protein
MLRLLSISLIALVLAAGCAREREAASTTDDDGTPRWQLTRQTSGTDALLVGLDAVNASTVWAGGASGTLLRTTDGGQAWRALPAPGPDSLQFRDVEAFGERTAYALSAGPGAASRIYKTRDGGETWQRQFQSDTPEAFFDCMAFWDARHGLVFSDVVDGEFIVLRTADGGEHWRRVPPEALPDALPGEASFAASGTCLRTRGESTAWFGTAGATGTSSAARVFRTTNRGRSWSVSETPLERGESAGIASLVFRGNGRGMAFGGDLRVTDERGKTAARTRDGGESWQLAAAPLEGATYGAAYVPGMRSVVAAGPGGVSFSADEGRSWTMLDTTEHWSVDLAGARRGWAVGPDGRITRIERQR